MKKFRRPHIAIPSLFVVIIAALVGYVLFGRPAKVTYSVISVKRSDIVREVNVTGRVKPAESVDLAFERSGRINRVFVAVGDKVVAGEPLASIENSELAADLAQAEARLKAERAKLDELARGARPEEIEIQEAKVKSARVALLDAKRNLIDKLEDAYTKSDDGVRNRTDQIFINPRSAPQLKFQVADSQLENNLKFERQLAEGLLIGWRSSLDDLTVTSDFNPPLALAKKNLNYIKSLLDKAALALSGAIPTSNLSQATIDGWRVEVSTARANINAVITNLTGAEEKFGSAESNLLVAREEFALKNAGTVSEQIRAQEARREEAEANVKKIQAQLSKTTLTAPFSGIVSKEEADIGEIVKANEPVVSLISDAQFEIEAHVPEADIATITVGKVARVTLDAYGSDIFFDAAVSAIDPAETIIDGVATYRVIFQFREKDGRIKSGMTANIDIITEQHKKALVIPQRAVTQKDGEKIVRILRDNKVHEIKVITGIRGSDGTIEIIDGLEEGDRVVLFGGQ